MAYARNIKQHETVAREATATLSAADDKRALDEERRKWWEGGYAQGHADCGHDGFTSLVTGVLLGVVVTLGIGSTVVWFIH